MPSKNTLEKTNWHPADIGAALKKRGWSLSRLSRFHGLARSFCEHAIRRPFPKGERLIAEAIGVPPEDIWPERFAERAAKAAARAARQRRVPVTTKARRPRAPRKA